ncbi:uncharacterized protein F5891DRAFT_1184355 [Suillus fuscotomentosus]|uniref:Uncharacterized protein n=1 Tax=Suillus fuscotomentosus TaxID=1912939 RepID=A0AAD4EFU0_9AGAM|nr:uncharacterized protein F5891DRAFT_1184355 [Suillus fuscotomentosus]KAG1904173.1 hypothetical protein F5891DRAFT_1184355 [Suillus fuscotomentosus]
MAHRKRATSVSSSSSSNSSISSQSAVAVPLKKISKKLTRPKKKRCSSDDDEKMIMEPETDPHEELVAAARCIARCIDVFCKTKQLIMVGLSLQQRDAAENGDVSEDEDIQASRDKSPKIQDRYKRNYARLLQLVLSLKPLLGDPRKSLELNAIIKKMDATISTTHSDDTLRLKNQISHYTAFNLRSPIMPPIYDGTGSRTHLGSNHPVLARFLCPVRELKEFSKDTEKAQKKLQNSKIKMTASALPAFLWAGDLPGKDYDDNNMFEGMFEGHLLERMMRHIFTSPLSAYGEQTRATRTCNAALHDMTTVEAAHIAYGCLQVRFGIGAKNTWSEVNGDFNYRDFYNNIVDLIEDSPDPEWKDKLLRAWNMKLFKNEEGREGDSITSKDNNISSTSHEGRDDDLERVRAQMVARRAAKAAPAHPPSPPPSLSPPPPPRESMPACPSGPMPSRETTPVPPPTPRPVATPRPV